MLDLKLIAATDPEVAAAMELELSRQRDHIELIASENFVSPAVMAAMGSHLTNKYAEGYPGKRYSAAANMLILLKIWRATARASFSARNMPMCSPIPEPRQIWRPMRPCCSRGTPLWAWTSPAGDI